MKKIELPITAALQAGPPSEVVMATCVDSEGKPNIITLGMYMALSHKPPLLCMGVSPLRYSHDLIIEAGEFVINVPSIDLEKEMHYCGTKSGRNVDKFAETGLTPIPAGVVKPPLIEECYGHLECKVVAAHPGGDHTLIVGEILRTSLNEDVVSNNRLIPLKTRSIYQKNHVYFTLTGDKS